MLFKTLVRLQLGIFSPGLYLLHGLLYASNPLQQSIALQVIVYLIKISYAAVACTGLMVYGLRVFKNRISLCILFSIFTITITSTIGSITHAHQISTFYFFADAIGFSIFPVYFSVLHYHFLRQPNANSEIFYLCYINTISTTISLAVYFVLSDGMKVSTPPDNAVAIAICLCYLFLFSQNLSRGAKILVVTCVTLNVALSGMRALIVVPTLCLMFVFFRYLVKINLTALTRTTAIAASTIILVTAVGGDRVHEKIRSLEDAITFVTQNSTHTNLDPSIEQRAIETNQIFEQMNKAPSSYLTGIGFGALYENHLISHEHYASLQHHAHVTPAILLLRNGIGGLALFISALAISIIWSLSRDDARALFAFAILCQLASSLFDQYAYWAFNFAFALAAWSAVCRTQKPRKPEPHKQFQ